MPCPQCGNAEVRKAGGKLRRYLDRVRGRQTFQCLKCGRQWTRVRQQYRLPVAFGGGAPLPPPRPPARPQPPPPVPTPAPDSMNGSHWVAVRAFDSLDRMVDLVARMEASRAAAPVGVSPELLAALAEDDEDRAPTTTSKAEEPEHHNEVLLAKVAHLEAELARMRRAAGARGG